MKKIVTAMGNPTLNNELKKYAKYDVIGDDLFYQDAVIDLLEQESVDILTLSGLLQGQWELNEFIEKIEKTNFVGRIIIIMSELDSDIKCELLEKGIHDIFLDDTVEVQDILNAIDRDEPIRKRLEKENLKLCEKPTNIYNPEEKVVVLKECQRQEIIVISGVNGAGKSTIAFNLSTRLAKRSNAKVLVIDFDTLAGNIDELFDINKVPQNIELNIDIDKKCGLNYAADLIEKNRFDANVFDEIVIHENGLDILTGNTSLYYCQEVLNEQIYERILECAKEKYDFIILDTSSNIFLDSTRWCMQKATKIFFVMENNYLNIKKAIQLLDVSVNTWGVLKEKIDIIINKENTFGLENDLMEKILEKYKIIGNIKLKEENNEMSYDKILENIKFVPKTNLIDKMISTKNSLKNILDKKFIRKEKEVLSDVN